MSLVKRLIGTVPRFFKNSAIQITVPILLLAALGAQIPFRAFKYPYSIYDQILMALFGFNGNLLNMGGWGQVFAIAIAAVIFWSVQKTLVDRSICKIFWRLSFVLLYAASLAFIAIISTEKPSLHPTPDFIGIINITTRDSFALLLSTPAVIIFGLAIYCKYSASNLLSLASGHINRRFILVSCLLMSSIMLIVIFYNFVTTLVGSARLTDFVTNDNRQYIAFEQAPDSVPKKVEKYIGPPPPRFELHIDSQSDHYGTYNAHESIYFGLSFMESLIDKTTGELLLSQAKKPGDDAVNYQDSLSPDKIGKFGPFKVEVLDRQSPINGKPIYTEFFTLSDARANEDYEFYFETKQFNISDNTSGDKSNHYPNDKYNFDYIIRIVFPDSLAANRDQLPSDSIVISQQPSIINVNEDQMPQRFYIAGSGSTVLGVIHYFGISRNLQLRQFIYFMALAPMLPLLALGGNIMGAKRKQQPRNIQAHSIAVCLAILVILPIRQVIVPSAIPVITYVDQIFGLEIMAATVLLILIYIDDLMDSTS